MPPDTEPPSPDDHLPPEEHLVLSQEHATFLMGECDRLLGLYREAQSSALSVFNFYLTFITAVLGGLIFLLQNDARSRDTITGAALLFAALAGTAYLSALAGRYAHAARYAATVDEIRRYVARRLSIPMPPAYDRFMAPIDSPKVQTEWYVWLFPVGSFAMFIAIINSTALAAVAAIVLAQSDVGSGRALLAFILVFGLSLTIYNVYSRLTIQRFTLHLHVRIDTGDLTLWAARE